MLSPELKMHQLSLNGSEREYLIEKAQFIKQYAIIVIALSSLFICLVSAFCVHNLKKMGF